jgi:hypothetical protein
MARVGRPNPLRASEETRRFGARGRAPNHRRVSGSTRVPAGQGFSLSRPFFQSLLMSASSGSPSVRCRLWRAIPGRRPQVGLTRRALIHCRWIRACARRDLYAKGPHAKRKKVLDVTNRGRLPLDAESPSGKTVVFGRYTLDLTIAELRPFLEDPRTIKPCTSRPEEVSSECCSDNGCNRGSSGCEDEGSPPAGELPRPQVLTLRASVWLSSRAGALLCSRRSIRRAGMRLDPQQKAIRRRATAEYKKAATEYKSGLIRLESRLQEVNPREAARLGRIIARLESWQNT